MPYEIDGEECLSMKEIERYLGWTWITVKNHLDERGFPYWTVPGKGMRKYYRKSDVDQLKVPRSAGQINGSETQQ